MLATQRRGTPISSAISTLNIYIFQIVRLRLKCTDFEMFRLIHLRNKENSNQSTQARFPLIHF